MMIKVIKQPSKEDWQEIVKRPVFENISLEFLGAGLTIKLRTIRNKKQYQRNTHSPHFLCFKNWNPESGESIVDI